MKTWKTYVAGLSSEQKTKLLNAILDHYIDEYESDSEIKYNNGEDEELGPECLYWDSCGESLI